MQLIDGKKIADRLLKTLKPQGHPTLAVILVGQNPASHLYVSLKEKKAKELKINFQKYLFPSSTATQIVQQKIKELNEDSRITAILVQLPLPQHLNTNKIISAIDPAKDADGIHPSHLKLLKQGQSPPILPATTGAILQALKATKVNLKNKSVAIIGKSTIVGLPTYYYLKNTVNQINIYDSHTKNLSNKTSQADILIVAIGQPKFITQKYIKPGAIVIDVGINKLKGKTIGDVDFDKVKNKAAWITPVPGGLGPLTVSFLLLNTILLSSSLKMHQKDYWY